MNKHILVDQDVTVFIRYSLQARVSQDYHLEPEQWRIGMSSILASALNLAPSKDTFWTTERQPGNPLYPGKRDDQFRDWSLFTITKLLKKWLWCISNLQHPPPKKMF